MKSSSTKMWRAVFLLVVIASGLSITAAAQNIVLYGFTGQADGWKPNGLIEDAAGNFYGTTLYGGNPTFVDIGWGTVFELTFGLGSWNLTTVYAFNGSTDGGFPLGNIVRDAAGNLFGVTTQGGDPTCNCGVVFEVSPSATGWVFSVLHTFTGGSDGGYPTSALVIDAAGHLYGAAGGGGNTTVCQLGCGLVYELFSTANGWTEKPIYVFGSSLLYSVVGLVPDTAGNLYAAASGGASNGAILEFSPTASGRWQVATLHKFSGGRYGVNPAQLILDANDNLYGTATGGKLTGCQPPGCGIIFELTHAASTWREAVLHTFSGGYDGYDGSSVVVDAQGNLYGTALAGGKRYGTVFKLSASNGWSETVLYAFDYFTDGAAPQSLSFGTDGNLYGVTYTGGGGCLSMQCGVAFGLAP